MTCNGAATFNGNVTLGNATADDITVTGSLASSIPIKTNNSYDIGSATLGLRKLYLGNAGAGATCDIVSASHATTREYTIPDCGAAANFVMTQLAQSVTGVKTFNDGIVLDDAAGQSTLNNYQVSSTASTFTFNGSGGTTGSKTMRYKRIGDWVTIHFPSGITGTSGTSSTTLTANTALDSFARPLTATQAGLIPDMVNNSVSLANPGTVAISTGGIITIFRDDVPTAWTNSSTCGSNTPFSITYYVGTGS